MSGTVPVPTPRRWLKRLQSRGFEAVAMFRRVQVRVRSTIGQEPWLGFSALGEVYLTGVPQPEHHPRRKGALVLAAATPGKIAKN